MIKNLTVKKDAKNIFEPIWHPDCKSAKVTKLKARETPIQNQFIFINYLTKTYAAFKNITICSDYFLHLKKLCPTGFTGFDRPGKDQPEQNPSFDFGRLGLGQYHTREYFGQ